MEENPYKALAKETFQPPVSRFSPLVGVACCAVVATCAYVMLSELNQSLDLPAYVFLSLNFATWLVSAATAFGSTKRAFYGALILDAAVFLSGVIFAAVTHA